MHIHIYKLCFLSHKEQSHELKKIHLFHFSAICGTVYGMFESKYWL